MRTIPIIGPFLSLLKVIIVALFIAVILFVLLRLILGHISGRTKTFAFLFLIALISWTLWTNSYWADIGYYDNYRIPLGDNKELQGAFGQGSIELKKSICSQELTAFALTDSIMYGILEKEKDTAYIIYDIKKDSLLTFNSYDEYLNNKRYLNPLLLDNFKLPEENYYGYWGNWLWLY